MNERCKATSKSGERCKAFAGENGLCKLHSRSGDTPDKGVQPLQLEQPRSTRKKCKAITKSGTSHVGLMRCQKAFATTDVLLMATLKMQAGSTATGKPLECTDAHQYAQAASSTAPRCGARTRRGTPCAGPAMHNGRCRMHGGMSTGPRTAAGLDRSRHANWKHGAYSLEAKRANKVLRQFIRECRENVREIEAACSCTLNQSNAAELHRRADADE
jgi:hypothetical protein